MVLIMRKEKKTLKSLILFFLYLELCGASEVQNEKLETCLKLNL